MIKVCCSFQAIELFCENHFGFTIISISFYCSDIVRYFAGSYFNVNSLVWDPNAHRENRCQYESKVRLPKLQMHCISHRDLNKTIFCEVCYDEEPVRLTPHTFPVCKLEVLSRLYWLPVMSCNGLKCVCRSEVALHLSEGNQTTFSSSSRLSWQWPEATHSSAQSLTSPSSYQRNLINTEILGLPPYNNL